MSMLVSKAHEVSGGVRSFGTGSQKGCHAMRFPNEKIPADLPGKTQADLLFGLRDATLWGVQCRDTKAGASALLVAQWATRLV